MMRRFIYASVLAFALPLPGATLSQTSNDNQPVPNTVPQIELGGNFDRLNIVEHAIYLTDSGTQTHLKNLLAKVQEGILHWQKPGHPRLSLGLTKQTLWLAFRLKNISAQPLSLYLLSEDPLTNRLDVYRQLPAGDYEQIQTGLERPFHNRPFPHHRFIIPVQLQPSQEQKYYLRYDSHTALFITTYLFNTRELWQYTQNESLFLFLYYGCLLVMFVYNLFIYISIRDRVYLYYLTYLAAFFFFSMAFTGLGNRYLWPNASAWWADSLVPISIWSIALTLQLFILEFIDPGRGRPRFHTYVRITIFVYVASSVITVAAGRGPVFVIVSVSLLLIAVLVGSVVILYHGFVENNRQAIFLIAAFGVLVPGLALSGLRSIGLVPDNLLTRYLYLLGSALEVMVLALGLADRINTMKRAVVGTEKKYRHLVEDAPDVIFTLDAHGIFRSVNGVVQSQLGYTPQELLGSHFTDITGEINPEQTKITRAVVDDAVAEALSGKSNADFTVSILTKFRREPIPMSVKLHGVVFEGRREIIGKAATVQSDKAYQFLDSEEQTFYLDNYISNAEILSHRLTDNVRRYLDPMQVNILRISLREMLINAIEHGNLGITYEQKSATMADGSYVDFLRSRQLQEPYRSRRIKIHYKLNAHEAVYRIVDQGEGFDYRRVLAQSLSGISDMESMNGRGIAIACSAFDSVEYSHPGNHVTLAKRFAAA